MSFCLKFPPRLRTAASCKMPFNGLDDEFCGTIEGGKSWELSLVKWAKLNDDQVYHAMGWSGRAFWEMVK